jgi:hypothetical protein
MLSPIIKFFMIFMKFLPIMPFRLYSLSYLISRHFKFTKVIKNRSYLISRHFKFTKVIKNRSYVDIVIHRVYFRLKLVVIGYWLMMFIILFHVPDATVKYFIMNEMRVKYIRINKNLSTDRMIPFRFVTNTKSSHTIVTNNHTIVTNNKN